MLRFLTPLFLFLAGSAVVWPERALVPICRTSTATWQNITTPIYSTTFTAEFDATPSTSAIDAYIGTSEGWAAANKHLATTVHFTTAGKLVALDANGYKSVTVISYTGGTKYHFRILVSLADKKYSAFVKVGAGAEQTIATNYRFRTAQSTVKKQDNIGFKALTGSLAVCYGDSGIINPPDTTTPPPLPPDTVGTIAIAVGENWQTKINAYPESTTFRPLPGVHVQQSVVPKNKDRILCEPGAIMDGQNVKQFAIWEGGGPTYPNNVTIRRCEIKNYVPPTQLAAIRMNTYSITGARGWVIDSNHVHNNAQVGIRAGPFALVKYNNVHDQGTLGVSGVGDGTTTNGGIIYEHNEIHHNNPTGTGLGFESGGSKFVLTKGLILRYNWVHDNKGPGLWCDIANDQFDIHDNVVEDNKQEGIGIEISYGGKIYNNTVKRNGLDDERAGYWPWGSGIGIHASGGTGIEIYGNTLEGNAHGIALLQQARGKKFPGEPQVALLADTMKVQNINIHNNTITLIASVPGHVQPGSLGATLGADDTSWPNRLYSGRNIVINNNTYILAGKQYPFAWNDGYRNATYWRTAPPAGAGFDVSGSITP